MTALQLQDDLHVLGNAEPIYLIGESHVFTYGHTIIEHRCGELFLSRPVRVTNLSAHNFCAEDGKPHPELLDDLRAQKLLVGQDLPLYLAATNEYAHYTGRPLTAPVMVFFEGDRDIHALYKKWDHDYDFIIPENSFYDYDKSKKSISFATVEKQVESCLSPFIAGLRQLRDMGFKRILVHCLPPRTKNADTHYGSEGSNQVIWAKLTWVANRYLAQACKRENLLFIDIWPHIAEQGFLPKRYDLDGIHLSREGMLISLSNIIACLHDHTHLNVTDKRYHLAFSNSISRNKPQTSHSESWNKEGWITGQVNATVTAALKEKLNYSPTDSRTFRFDWITARDEKSAAIEMAEPSLE